MVIVSLALIVLLLIRRKSSAYRAIVLGITVFVGLLILDTAVAIRYFGFYPHASGTGINMGLNQIIHSSDIRSAEMFSNIAIFLPFGFFLSEFLSSRKQFSTRRRIGLVTLAAFGLSLCIEFLQLILHVGFFELTDLVMNTVGGFIGVAVSNLGRLIISIVTNTETH